MIANAITCCRIILSLLMFLYSAIFVCLVATFAAIQEGHIIRSQ